MLLLDFVIGGEGVVEWRMNLAGHSFLWAKTDGPLWHPLLLHLIDVAASADAILAREPSVTRLRLASVLGLDWDHARPWLLLVIASHDLGKACPGFQCKWDGAKDLLARMNLRVPPGVDDHVNHGFVSQIVLTGFLAERGWPEDLAVVVSDAVGCHHGERASPTKLESLESSRKALGDQGWRDVRHEVFKSLMSVFGPGKVPTKEGLAGPDFMLLAGLTSFADWIGSNTDWFPFGSPKDCDEPRHWFESRRKNSDLALDSIGWGPREPLQKEARSFRDVFGFSPRPLQVAADTLSAKIREPCVLLVEAPMGEGKTEAAFSVYLDLQRRLGHRGLYVALPTKATGNAMFERTLTFLSRFPVKHRLDLQLLHGATLLNDSFQALRLASIHDTAKHGNVKAGEWFSHKKRALLSEYGVGTVDQALLTILPVRHHFVRLWGLANRVVVFDEIHAYDAYTGTLLLTLLQWLLALGSSVILLSATLPPSFRRALARKLGSVLPETEAAYPRLSLFQPGAVEQVGFKADPKRRLRVRLEGIAPDIPSLQQGLDQRVATGGFALALVNTVQRAQDLYRRFPEGKRILRESQVVGKELSDGTEIYLFHARFPADKRQVREDSALSIFGKEGTREGKKILIATQVAEQSLDLDFDVMISDLAPIDLLLQRAGRLWRHERPTASRHQKDGPNLTVVGLIGEEPCSFEKPLWWSMVYREDLLLRTWALLRSRSDLALPDEIDDLVGLVYEDQVEMPPMLQERLEKAVLNAEGTTMAHRGMANLAVIGFPDDASWNDLSRFIKYDEDEPGLHPTLVAQTRLGEPSVVAIPLFPSDGFDPRKILDMKASKALFVRALSLSRKGVVFRLQSIGVPEGWKESSLLRNCMPLLLDDEGRWTEDATVRLDEELGLVYEPKETE